MEIRSRRDYKLHEHSRWCRQNKMRTAETGNYKEWAKRFLIREHSRQRQKSRLNQLKLITQEKIDASISDQAERLWLDVIITCGASLTRVGGRCNIVGIGLAILARGSGMLITYHLE
jgi:hypothetical protein